MNIPILLVTIVFGVLVIVAAVAAVVVAVAGNRRLRRSDRRAGRADAADDDPARKVVFSKETTDADTGETVLTVVTADGMTTVTRTTADGRTTEMHTRADLPEGSLEGLARSVGAEYLQHMGSNALYWRMKEMKDRSDDAGSSRVLEMENGGVAGFGFAGITGFIGNDDELARTAAAHRIWLPGALDRIGHFGTRMIDDYMRGGTAYGTLSAYTFRRDRDQFEAASLTAEDAYAFVYDMCRFGRFGSSGIPAEPGMVDDSEIPQWREDMAALAKAAEATGEQDIDRSDVQDDFGNAHHLIIIKAEMSLSYATYIALYRAFARCVSRVPR
ncbi:hypothetical protein CSQ85_08765 [Bifidobacterium rousetti]|uniref:hypothetical protein n=1 Tax=Bifidobacterium rousetti TaxID=2045439 RepID=UPI001239661A|nr:hypothetical protein [Bifidobacterium rousetti]KAA8818573.1 hypothetical protein CSQ85_08765 [Bifidobacterium rousetti]